MAKKNKQEAENEEAAASSMTEYARELEYEKSLPRRERKVYRKNRRRQGFSDWVDKHWFPFLLFCAVILMCSAITILLAFNNKL